MSDKEMCFSDEQLYQLRTDFELHREEQDRRWESMSSMVEQNTQTTRELAENVRSIAEDTAGIVQGYRDWQGTVRIGSSVQRFIVKLAGLGVAGAALATGIMYVIERFGSGPPA